MENLEASLVYFLLNVHRLLLEKKVDEKTVFKILDEAINELEKSKK